MEKNLSFFSFIYELNSKKRTYNKPNTVQILHLPPKDTKTLLLKTENHETLFAENASNSFSVKTEAILSLYGIFHWNFLFHA